MTNRRTFLATPPPHPGAGGRVADPSRVAGHLPRLLLAAAALVLLLAAVPPRAAAVEAGGGPPLLLAQMDDAPQRPLEPRYQPVPPPEKSWYNDSYLFAMTRGVADSTLVPAAKVPLYLLTVPLDIVLLPFAAIGGMFG